MGNANIPSYPWERSIGYVWLVAVRRRIAEPDELLIPPAWCFFLCSSKFKKAVCWCPVGKPLEAPTAETEGKQAMAGCDDISCGFKFNWFSLSRTPEPYRASIFFPSRLKNWKSPAPATFQIFPNTHFEQVREMTQKFHPLSFDIQSVCFIPWSFSWPPPPLFLFGNCPLPSLPATILTPSLPTMVGSTPM